MKEAIDPLQDLIGLVAVRLDPTQTPPFLSPFSASKRHNRSSNLRETGNV